MNLNFLDFEQPIAELQAKIEELRYVSDGAAVSITDEIGRLQARARDLTRAIFASLTPWQIARLARHPQRPFTLDYVQRLCTDFEELHGDRRFGDDPALVAGVARFNGRPVAILGHQKGRNTRENLHRNFGMPRPEGYRKALRVMELAERFRLPVLSFIDTPGAFPGIDAEARGQSAAIAENLLAMATLRVPIVATVIGEGGSGGALAIGVCDRLLMLQYGTYAVISPEGCASILWKSAEKAAEAAEAMGLTSGRLHELGLVDEVIEEPLGGAHRDPDAMAQSLGERLQAALGDLGGVDASALVERRTQRLRRYGQFRDG